MRLRFISATHNILPMAALVAFLPATATRAEVDRPIQGQILDAITGEAVALARVELRSQATDPPLATVASDSSGRFSLRSSGCGLHLRIQALGYRKFDRVLDPDSLHLELRIRLQPRPLLMEEMTVQALKPGASTRTPAFVEVISVDAGQAGSDLPQLLDRATGVKIRRYGGLGSFSTVSIRGSTAEQVQVFLDGVPLNQAIGGGVDLGTLPTGGIESVEVYRGSVPGRFGGNSIGGVVHLKTKEASGQRHFRMKAAAGSFGTQQITALGGGRLAGPLREVAVLAMADYGHSGNDFRFLDDNGTTFNASDDQWAVRQNSDFQSLRTLAKLDGYRGSVRIQLQNVLDIRHKGIPGIGNFQAADVRFDTWRSTSELELFGTTRWLGYRVALYHLLQQEEYKDLRGEVGLGIQHERNRTSSLGVRTEGNVLLRKTVATVFASGRREVFDPRSLLTAEDRLFESVRKVASVGVEVEVPDRSDRLLWTVGTQAELIDDELFGPTPLGSPSLQPTRTGQRRLWGAQTGIRLELNRGWQLKGHVGRHQRAPSFYELFGDRGAVIGNADLESERSLNADIGFVFRANNRSSQVQLFEAVAYRNSARDLIRFVHNSQLVTQPQNIGDALIRGVELRSNLRVAPWLRVSGNYVYQLATNLSERDHERGNDLPNAPRHNLNVRGDLGGRDSFLYYEISQEGQHFLDRSNLRSVRRRVVHGAGARMHTGTGAELSAELRNVTANQVVDLWGYPLPGRSFFLALQQDFAVLGR